MLGGMTMRVAARDVPVLALICVIGVATVWTLLGDVELVSPHRQWVGQEIVALAVLIVPFVALWHVVSQREVTGLWAFVAPLVGAYLVAHYYAFDVYDSPPYSRNADAGDMPGWAIVVGASVAAATGALTRFHQRLGIVMTVPVCLGCYVLVFFSNVFH
jgi:hypothetical protein